MAKSEATSADQSIDGKADVETTMPPKTPSLDLQDLAKILNLINIAIKRGTYDPKELREVLDSYEKLEAFLQFQAQMQAAQKQPAEEGDA